MATDPSIEILTPFAQGPQNGMVLLLRTRAEPTSLAPAVRRSVAEIDPTLAITSIRTMDQVRATSMARPRFLMTMLLLFAGVGMVLAIAVVYGVLAQLARSRTREMAIAGLIVGSLAALIATRALGLGIRCQGR